MKELFGRKNELGLLEKRYESPYFEFGYVYGQRRIGKTALMQMFSKGKKSLLFYATESSDSINLSSFASTLSSVSGRHYGQFENWYSFFQAIDAYFGDEKGVMVIDEYTNIVAPGDARKRKTDFQSSLQKAIDLLFVKRRFVLILTGSNVSFMEREIGNGEAPLYKRNTFSLRVGKFDFDESLLAFGKAESDWEKARLLCLTSTFPYYLSLIDDSQSLEANLDLLFYNQDAVFVDSPSKIITSAKAWGWWYSSILDAIANGYGTLNGICAFLKADSNEIYNYIKELIADGVWPNGNCSCRKEASIMNSSIPSSLSITVSSGKGRRRSKTASGRSSKRNSKPRLGNSSSGPSRKYASPTWSAYRKKEG